jgi:predicted ester cyclase
VTKDKIERNKATFLRQQHEILSQGDMNIMETVFAPTFVRHRSGMGNIAAAAGVDPYPTGLDVYDRQRHGFGWMRKAFPNQDRVVEEMIGEGDLIAARFTIYTAFEGPLLGFPPTGQKVEITEFGFMRFDDDGLMTDAWYVLDELGLLTRLGIVNLRVNADAD